MESYFYLLLCEYIQLRIQFIPLGWYTIAVFSSHENMYINENKISSLLVRSKGWCCQVLVQEVFCTSHTYTAKEELSIIAAWPHG